MSYKDNNEVRETKRQAKNLRDFFASRGVDVPHTMALEAVSRLIGDKFWNVTRAKAQSVDQQPTARKDVVQVLPCADDDAYMREDGALRVWLEADWTFSGQFEVHVSHPLSGYLGCQVKVWWNQDLVFEEWKTCILDLVVKAVRPVVDETLSATMQERQDLAFEVLEYCCGRAGIVEDDVLGYVQGMVADWRNR